MDAFSAQEISSQQVPTQPSATSTLNLVQEPPQKRKSFRKFFNISSWIILFALLPITVLIFLSQDSIPGDLFYPVKRSLENVILAAASVSPAARAAFRTDLTETRFKEARSLVLSRSNTSGLSAFIDEVQGTQLEVASLTSDTERKNAEEKLIIKIAEYQNNLSALQAKTEQNIVTYQFQEAVLPTSTPIPPTPTVIPSPTPRIIGDQLSPQPSSTPIPLPTSTPLPSVASTVSLVTISPIQVSPPLIANSVVVEQRKIAQTLKETKDRLHKIKKDLEENRNEDRQKDDKRSESETFNKEDSNKKTETPDRQK